jgi:hypothetical protein
MQGEVKKIVREGGSKMNLKSFWLVERDAERGDNSLQATQDGG